MANKLINNTQKIDFNMLESRINKALIAKDSAPIISFKPPAPNYFNLPLGQLLSLQDQQFIEACFCTILGREADQESVNHYLKKLQQGYHPWSIIAFLRYSKEGKIRFKDNDHQLPSLSKYRLFSLPIVGKLIVKLLPLYRKLRQR